MITKQLTKQLIIWSGLLIIFLVLIRGYQTNWWDKNDLVTPPAGQNQQHSVDQIMTDLANWGYRIYLVNMATGEVAGEAAYKWQNDEFIHLIVVNLPDLPAESGQFYQAWFERPDPRGFIKTGKLEKQADGRYVLLFISSRSYQDFPRVIISQETNDEEFAPTQIILKGSFK